MNIPGLKKKDSTPTRQVTGTSYTAQGADGIKPPDMKELGSNVANILVDPVPDVGTPVQAARTYTKMVRDDASVRMSLRAGKAPVLGAEYYFEPYSDDPIDLAAAELCDYNLFYGMTVPWIKVVEQILKMYEAGKTVFEPVWELREWAPRKASAGANRRQYTMLRKLAFRPPSTILKVNYDDNGGPVSVTHNAINAEGQATQVDIPIEKLVVFTFDTQEGGLEGMSILRSAYKHWWYKDKLYAIDAIQKERHGIGVPDIELQPGYSPADLAAAHQLGRNLRTNEHAYIVRTTALNVGFAELKGQLVNALQSATHHDDMIMKNIMVQFLTMGSEGGGRATSATAMDMFLKSMRHVANSICDSINMYLVPNLVAYNFKTDRFPTLKCRGVGEVKDLQMFSAAMRNLADTDLISIDESTEQWVRAQVDMPRLTTPWTPPSQRPEKVQELIQVAGGDKTTQNGKVAATSTTATDKSNNGGAGNTGKDPTSGN